MQFILGLYAGLFAGFVLRGLFNNIEYRIRHDGLLHGKNEKD